MLSVSHSLSGKRIYRGFQSRGYHSLSLSLFILHLFVDDDDNAATQQQDRELDFDMPDMGNNGGTTTTTSGGRTPLSRSLTKKRQTPNNFVLNFWEFLLTFVFLGLTSTGNSNNRRALAPAPEDDDDTKQKDTTTTPLVKSNDGATEDAIPDMSQ